MSLCLTPPPPPLTLCFSLPTAPPRSPPAILSGWSAVFDTTHQAYYYHNFTTDETSWVLPATVAESHPA
ncbi:unnamed protein product, partial [Ectocarpus sp. 8 AP-2014]